MKISTKGRYALRMLIDLNRYQGDGYVSLKDVAQRENISKKYLEQIVPVLNRSGILCANRGYQGGYRLASPADQISVYDVLKATEVSLACVACLEEHAMPCERKEFCPNLPVWKKFDELVKDYFSKITLQDMIQQQGEE